MINVLAIDDEPLALRQLESYIAKVPYLTLIASCSSAAAARQYIELADAVFIDINMPDLNGLDFVRSLSSPPLIVFTTAYSEYALDGFRVNAVDYLLKPFSLKEFISSCEKLDGILKLKAAASARPDDEVLQFKVDYRTVNIEVGTIDYVESMSEYVKIHVKDADAPIIVLYSLKRLETQLPKERFIRIHRSYIVSLDYIASASRTSVRLKDGTELPVGEVYRPAFTKAVLDNKPQ